MVGGWKSEKIKKGLQLLLESNLKGGEIMAIEFKNDKFFRRSVEVVAQELSERIYDRSIHLAVKTNNPGKIIRISTPEGDRDFKIAVAEPFLELDATPIWKGKRAEKLRQLNPGETITFRSRSGVLTFIKTEGADNIFLHTLENLATKQKIGASRISGLLGLSSGDTGRLSFIENDQFEFIRL